MTHGNDAAHACEARRARRATRSASAAAAARVSARPSGKGVRRARRPAPATTARASASKAVRCRCSAASRSAASRTRSATEIVRGQRRRLDERFDAGHRRPRGAARRRAWSRAARTTVKILGEGELTKKLTVKAQRVLGVRQGEDREGRRHGRASSRSAPKRRRPPPLSKASMASGFANIGKIPELRRRILFTLALLAVYRIGVVRHDPGREPRRSWRKIVNQALGHVPRHVQHVLGRRARAAVDLRARHHAVRQRVDHPAAAHGRRPQARAAPEGRRAWGGGKINQYTRYGSVVLSLIQSFFIARWLEGNNRAYAQFGQVVADPGLGFRLLTMLSLTTGTAFIMWLGEQITERGIGNGISLIIFAGIVADMPDAAVRMFSKAQDRRHRRPSTWPSSACSSCSVVAVIIFFERGAATDPGPVRQARRSAGRCTAGSRRTCRSRSTSPASSRRSSPRRS